MIAISLSAQKTVLIELKQNIKDKKSLTKSLSFIDNRKDRVIGTISEKGEEIELKLPAEDMNLYVQDWFSKYNKPLGSTNDIVLMLEELKIYNELDEGHENASGKVKLKISSFIKRNGKYYFINRFDNVIVSSLDAKRDNVRNISIQVSTVIAQFIIASYTNYVIGQYIPEEEIYNYNDYLTKSSSSFNTELKDGVYLNFKSFYKQSPAEGYYIKKNKKGKLTQIKNNQDQGVTFSDIYGYVDSGIAYIYTPVGFREMKKNDKGLYFTARRTELFAQNNSNGMIVGAIAGGLVGAAIGAAIDAGANKGGMVAFGYRTNTESEVYLDSLTGSFNFVR